MFHLQSVPFSCRYRTDMVCSLSVILADRDPDRQSVREALPCHVCPQFVRHAHVRLTQRRVQIGSVGRQILALTHTTNTRTVPLSATLRSPCAPRVDLRRARKAVQALVDLCALRTFCLPTVVPRADDPQHLVLRDTLWVQLTEVGKLLREKTFGRHGAAWRQEQQCFATQFHILEDTLTRVDLFTVYVQHLVAVVTQITQHLVAATDPVMMAYCTAADSPYVSIFVHLDAIAPTVCAELQHVFLQAQDARRRAFALYHPVKRRERKGHNATPETSPHCSGVEL